MSELVDFLLARVAEDEAVANDCEDVFPHDEPFGLEVQHDHQSRWSPARVLAECEAKRRIVALHRPVAATDSKADFGCGICHEEDGIVMSDGYCDTLLALALPFADHPDYDPTWRP